MGLTYNHKALTEDDMGELNSVRHIYNDEAFSGWVNALGQRVRFKEVNRSTDEDVVTYQMNRALKWRYTTEPYPVVYPEAAGDKGYEHLIIIDDGLEPHEYHPAAIPAKVILPATSVLWYPAEAGVQAVLYVIGVLTGMPPSYTSRTALKMSCAFGAARGLHQLHQWRTGYLDTRGHSRWRIEGKSTSDEVPPIWYPSSPYVGHNTAKIFG